MSRKKWGLLEVEISSILQRKQEQYQKEQGKKRFLIKCVAVISKHRADNTGLAPYKWIICLWVWWEGWCWAQSLGGIVDGSKLLRRRGGKDVKNLVYSKAATKVKEMLQSKQHSVFSTATGTDIILKTSFIPMNSAMSGSAGSLPTIKQLASGRHLVLLVPMLSHTKVCIFSKTPFQLASSPERPVPEWAWSLESLIISEWNIKTEHLLASCYSYF